jgi:undecaprenyl-diphosphatase
MTAFDAIVLGLVEGITEFLPVSSTGHLILARELLALPSTAATNAFLVVVQAASVLAILTEYRQTLVAKTLGVVQMEQESLQWAGKIVVAFLPAAVVGLFANHWIKEHLFNASSVAWALAIGGLAMIVVERRNSSAKKTGASVQDMSWKQALGIGLFQCLSLWPGTSRAMATILGARVLGMSAVASAEFSFFLAIPTILGATVLDLIQDGEALAAVPGGLPILALGFVVAFATSWLVIRGFIGFLKKNSLEVFGWYRILIAAAIALMLSR